MAGFRILDVPRARDAADELADEVGRVRLIAATGDHEGRAPDGPEPACGVVRVVGVRVEAEDSQIGGMPADVWTRQPGDRAPDPRVIGHEPTAHQRVPGPP